MKDSGMSNSQFMKAQKGFQNQYPEYNKLVEKLNIKSENYQNWFEKYLTIIKNCLKWIVRSDRNR
jgi:hypothetical protein